jgi:hypothetical protein
MRKGIVAICFLLLCPMLLPQTMLDNGSVIKTLKSGLSEGVIISTINASPANYNTSAEGLIALKKAGASDKLVAAIVVRNANAATERPTIFPAPAPEPPPVAAPVPIAAPVAPAIPLAVDSVGVYYKDIHGSWQEVNTEVVNFKTGGVLKHLASVGVVKGDLNGLIGGRKSRLGLIGPATFILYVPAGRSPGEYQLLRLHETKEGREFRSLTGAVVHVSDRAIRDTVEFTSKKLGRVCIRLFYPRESERESTGSFPP